MYLLKIYSAISLLILFDNNSFSQTIKNLDSLKQVVLIEKNDTATLNNYLKKLQALQNEDIAAKEIIYNWLNYF